jgi:ABC-type sugar transport system, periplasmic component
LPEFIEEGYLLELDKFIKDHPEAIEGFTSVVLEKYSKYKNKYFALPYAFDAQLLFYRKDLFEDIVIKRKFKNIYQTELKPPKTWKEFNVIAKFFTKHFNPDSPIDYGTTILGAHFPLAGILCEFLPRMWEYEGKTIDISGNIFMKERADIKGLENYIESFKYASPNSVENDWDEEVGEFCKGRAAMMCLFVAHATDITDRSKSEVVGKIGYDIIPGGIPVLGGWSLGININSNNRETAFDFIKWATSKEFAIPYTILGGFTPRIDLFKSSDLSTLYPWLSKALESFSLSRERSVLKVKTGRKISERDFENIYGKAIIKSIKKQLTPEKAIKEVQHEIIKLITKK